MLAEETNIPVPPQFLSIGDSAIWVNCRRGLVVSQFEIHSPCAGYNFARIHKALRITPAMAAGIADYVWSYGGNCGARKLRKEHTSLSDNFPTIISAIGAIGCFSFALRMRHFKISEKPPASRAGLTRAERQRRIRMVSWMSFGLGCFWLAAGLFFLWLGHSN